METFLRRWWVQKYKLPWTHEAAQELTWFELLTEWWEDYYDRNPKELRKRFADDDGEMYFSETGDDLIDKWERELAAGVTPDLEEGLHQEVKQGLKIERGSSKKAVKGMAALLGSEHKQYASKFVSPGSSQERAILGKGAPGAWVDMLGDD